MRPAIPALITAAFLATSAFAKLPPPTDEAKAKAAEAAAKSAWSNKVGGYQLCQVQNKIAGKVVHKAPAAPSAAASAAPMSAAASAPASAASAAAVARMNEICTDPGPFVAAVAERPLEAAGAHSPAETTKSPPNGKSTAAELQGGVKK